MSDPSVARSPETAGVLQSAHGPVGPLVAEVGRCVEQCIGEPISLCPVADLVRDRGHVVPFARHGEV
jgi:hypothetical protein